MACERSLVGGKLGDSIPVDTRGSFRCSSFVPCCGAQQLVTVEFEFGFGVVCRERRKAQYVQQQQTVSPPGNQFLAMVPVSTVGCVCVWLSVVAV